MSKRQVKFMCTAFRDGFQSVFGARVLTPDFLPALEAAKNAGISYFEAGGGARFQSLYFYCNEDAFDMMDQFRKTVGDDIELQTLGRGVNVVGLDSQPGDIIQMHADLFKKHGIDTIRNFDALNDVNNLIPSGKSIVQAGLKHQVCVTLMELPPGCTGAHDAEFYIDTLAQILAADLPFDSVCFKDASGTAVPSKVYETVKRARKMLPEDVSIHIHTHDTAGIGVATYQAALEAGADTIDLSLAPCSGGTCQPDVLVMWHALRGTDFALDVDVDKVREAQEVFKDCMKDYFVPPEALAVEPMIPWSPMPGGALTANTQMLRDNGIMDKYPAIIKAMGEVVERGGFGTSVTPVSQFYFQQAFNNVMFGAWEKIAESYGRMVLGYFGKTPTPPDPEIVQLAAKQLGMEPTKLSVLELNDKDPTKGVEPAKALLSEANLPITDENIFIVATCKEKGIQYLKGEGDVLVRKKTAQGLSATTQGPADGPFQITVNGVSYHVEIEGDRATVDGQSFDVSLEPVDASQSPQTKGAQIEVKASMPGKVLRFLTAVGTKVTEGTPLLILEAMKMEMKINAPSDGTVTSFEVGTGEQVAGGATLVILS